MATRRQAGGDDDGATPAPLPQRLAPQLATAVAAPPDGGDWIVETKFDGYRLLARIDADGVVRLFTRNGHDWTAKMPALADAIGGLGATASWIDGEIVVLSAAGVPDFNALQNAVDGGVRAGEAIVYFAFDLPFARGLDLRPRPLRERRAALAALLADRESGRLRLSATFSAPPADVLEAARRMGLEGIVVKRPESAYVSSRSGSWLKIKCKARGRFLVCAFTDRANAPGEIGSLLLATRAADGTLGYVGNVGTGWSAAAGRRLHARLAAIETRTPAVDVASVAPGRWSRRTAGGERWVEPSLCVDVTFAEMTPDGHVRHAVFVGVLDGATEPPAPRRAAKPGSAR